VKERACRAFQLLGEVEAAIHSFPSKMFTFTKWRGGYDCGYRMHGSRVRGAGREPLDASALNLGSGTVKCQHGTLPVPAPATLALLGEAPVYSAGPAMERVTPTGQRCYECWKCATALCLRCACKPQGTGGRTRHSGSPTAAPAVGEETGSATETAGSESIALSRP